MISDTTNEKKKEIGDIKKESTLEVIKKLNGELNIGYYDDLYKNPGEMQPFQQSGWCTMQEGQIAYTEMVVGALRKVKLQPRWKVLDVGCGIGEFLQTIFQKVENGTKTEFFGIEATPTGIKRISEEKIKLWPNTKKENFVQGLVPGGLCIYRDSTFDCLIVNSVFQYLTAEECKETVEQMIRIGKEKIVVADVHDKDLFDQVIEIHKKYGVSIDWEVKKKETFLSKDWWKTNFLGNKKVENIEFHHVNTKLYLRGHYRYVVTISLKQ